MSDQTTLVVGGEEENRKHVIRLHKLLSVLHLAFAVLALGLLGVTAALCPFQRSSTYAAFLSFALLGTALNLVAATLGTVTGIANWNQQYVPQLKIFLKAQYWLCIAGTVIPLAVGASGSVDLVHGTDGEHASDRTAFLSINIALSIMLGVICLLSLNLFCHSKETFGLETRRKRTENAISMIQPSLEEAPVRGLPQCPLPPTFEQSLSGGSIYGEGPPSYDVTVRGGFWE